MDQPTRGPIVFRRRVYTGPDDMPPRVRRAYERALSVLGDAEPSGATDAWEERLPNSDTLSPGSRAGGDQG